MGQIYLVRHGQASFGAADYDRLSQHGVEQARVLGEWFADTKQGFGQVVTGSLRRHKQTAAACLAEIPDAPAQGAWREDAGFDEYDHVDVLEKHAPQMTDPVAAKDALTSEANAKKAFQKIFAQAMERWMSGRHDADYRESWPAFRARVVAAMKRLVEDARATPSASIIVFTSGGPIAAVVQNVLGTPDSRAADINFSLANSSVTKLLFSSSAPGRISLQYLNNFSHLERTGEAQAVTYR